MYRKGLLTIVTMILIGAAISLAAGRRFQAGFTGPERVAESIEDHSGSAVVEATIASNPKFLAAQGAANKFYFVRQTRRGLQRISLNGSPLRVTDARSICGIGSEWNLNTTLDFDLDGFPEIFGHNQGNGAVRIWRGSPLGDYVPITPDIGAIGPEWELYIYRPLRGGSNIDIFGHYRGDNPTDPHYQEIHVWHMDGFRIMSSAKLGNVGLEWRFQFGDFNGDGTSDILGINNTGNLQVWFIGAGGTIIASKNIGQIGTEWQLQFADMNVDGYVDLFMGHKGNNELNISYNVPDGSGGRRLDGGNKVGVLPAGHQFQIADLNGDSIPDVLSQSTVSGEVHGFYWNGSSFFGDSDISAFAWIAQAGGSHLR